MRAKINSSSSLGPRASRPQMSAKRENEFSSYSERLRAFGAFAGRDARGPDEELECHSLYGAPGIIVALKLSLRVLWPRLSSLGRSLVLFNMILKPVSFEPLVTAPRQA